MERMDGEEESVSWLGCRLTWDISCYGCGLNDSNGSGVNVSDCTVLSAMWKLHHND